MKLAIVGGGGFRVPQIVEELAFRSADSVFVEQVCLYDVDEERLRVMRKVVEDMDVSNKPEIVATTSLREAVAGADFIFSAMRVGGAYGRVLDEQVALENGVLGQETVGPGGYAYAFRTIPAALELASTVAEVAPKAWVINFTNPAGVITQAMREVMGERVVGICDTPIGLVRRVVRALGLEGREFTYDYVGLNHLGWLRSVVVDGKDRLPELLASDELLGQIEEARIIGFDWVRQIGMLPNEYLFYYYRNREAVARLRGEQLTRGQFLADQQSTFYGEAALNPEAAAELWDLAHREREATYMVEAREIANEGDRHAEDLEGGGYQQVAADLMVALSSGKPAQMILGVANETGPDGLLVPGLSPKAVVEVPCMVDGKGLHPLQVTPLTGAEFGLVARVKACEEMVIGAVKERDAGLGWQAIASHPLVDSVEVGRRIFEGYCTEIPEVGEVFGYMDS